MESRLIYSIINSGNIEINWEIHNESEWIYIGLDKELNTEKVIKQIDQFFKNENFLIGLGRTNSKEISVFEIEKEILNRIGKENFKLSDLKFGKFIEFNKIGVMRTGKRKKTTDYK